LLVQVRAADGGAAASVLLSTDATDTGGSAVLLPSRVIAAVPGGGQQPLGSVLSSHDGISLSRSTVSDLLGVRVDASWVLNPVGFVALVNAVGGITADVDVDVDTTVNGIPVLVPQGERQKLDGMQAAAVLLYRPSSEDEIAAQPRVQHILDAVLGELPSGTELDKLLAALPEGSRPGDPISDYLEPLAQVSSAGLMLYQTLPIAPLDVDGRAIYRADSKGVAAMVKDSFPASELATGQIGSRVLVLNATGAPGLGELVRDRIVPAGFGFAGSRNQTPFGQKTTVIVVFDSAPESLARGKRLATALGLPNAPVQVSDRAQSVADLLVVVGSDFRP
jgi:hypothetical protein